MTSEKNGTKKKRWSVSGVVAGSKFLGVFEADTEAEAVEMALDSENAFVSLCHQCSDQCEDPQIESAVAWEVEEEGQGDEEVSNRRHGVAERHKPHN